MTSYLGRSDLPRGVRNNNPYNIRRSAANNWQGRVPLAQNPDSDFEQFQNYTWGVRAGVKVLRTYYTRYNLRTIRDILYRFSPPSENDTEAYIRAAASRTGFGANEQLPWSYEAIFRLSEAITAQENGRQWAISRAEFNRGWEAAGFAVPAGAGTKQSAGGWILGSLALLFGLNYFYNK